MTDAIALAPVTAPPVTGEQLDLVRRTIAAGASDAELKLFLYDCARRGVHPLDRLIHFTKRGGRYTPVVGIDYLRGRAHDTGEMAGSDDPVFDKDARTATVTVYRLTHGARYAYTATARYSEYVPDAGPNGRGDQMWRKMPHVMLGKCAEALALRKAFPQQLAGLYVNEELEQGRPDFTTEATEIADRYTPPPPSVTPPPTRAPEPADDGAPEDGRGQLEIHHFPAERLARLPLDVVLITTIDAAGTKNRNVTRYTLTLAGGPTWAADRTRVTTINDRLASAAEAAMHAEQAIKITVKAGRYGYELATIEDAHEPPPPLQPMETNPNADRDPITADDIPF